MRNSKKILSFVVAVVMVIASIQIAPVTAQGATAVKVTNGSSGGMGGGMKPGQPSSGTTSTSTFAIFDSSNAVVLSVKPVKAYSYILYSSPSFKSGANYTLYSGGSVSGSLINPDLEAHDYRYTGYNSSGATSSTITAG